MTAENPAPRISARAFGILQYLRTHPELDGISMSPAVDHLRRVFTEGVEALTRAYAELVCEGYVATPQTRCPVCGSLLIHKGGKTYIGIRQHWVKIGRTTGDVNRRIDVLNVRPLSVKCPTDMDLAKPLRLVHTIARDIEHDLHRQFAAHHVIGEWFEARPVLAALGVEA